MATFITVEGNLTGDPVLRTVPAASERESAMVSNLRIAVSERERDRSSGEWVSTPPVFYDVAVWGAPAEHVAGLTTGDRVVVHGELRRRVWADPDGAKRRSDTITAEMIGASLRFTAVAPVRERAAQP